MMSKPEMTEVQLNRNTDSLYKQIVDLWKNKILSGEIKPGDMLPSERELAASLNVSRIPVREAMKVLEYLGIVEQIRGKGVFVRQLDPVELLNSLGPMYSVSSTLLADLFDVRLLFEPHAAYLAAQNATEDDLKMIERTILRTDADLMSGVPIHMDSMDFHSAVMTASHNAVLMMLTTFLVELQKQSRRSTHRNRARMEQAQEHHKEIFARLKARDPYGAADMMRKHLVNARNQLYVAEEQP
ncbi:MAG: FadR family transcriptional regulator [Methylobacteriaceae bacterium]|jgi:GntR family transcriptional repressor for pyruvate dehydrogenase complex|nr:FadR family transcriptional regulator [Methylobacteriaceae bacterium]